MATSTGPSLTRTRSLRKPNPPTNTNSTSRSHLGSVSSSTGQTQTNTTSGVPTSRDRTGSPTRLPASKPAPRNAPPSTAGYLPSSGHNARSTSTVTATSTSTTDSALRKARPVTGTLIGRSASTAGTSSSTRGRISSISRGAPPRPPRSRYPPSASVSGTISSGPTGSTTTGATATASTRTKRPSSSGSLTSNTTSNSTSRSGPGGARLGHTRAKSSVTASSTTAAGVAASTTGRLISNAPVLRPPAQKPSSAAASTVATAPKTRSISPRHTRNNSAAEQDARPQTTSRPLSTTTSSSSSSKTPPLTSSTTLSSKPTPQLSKRPAFTTLQQHYSPLRKTGPKPLTATYLAPPSPSKRPANIAASAETSRLQTDLLQLHLLHRDAPAVDAAWRASARRALETRHADLARRNRQVRDAELEIVERANVAALRAWAGASASASALEPKIQGLDAVLNGLWGLDGPGGRYARVVRRFEKWCDRMVEADTLRRRVDAGDEHALLSLLGLNETGSLNETENGNAVGDGRVLVGGLDDAWKDDVAGLVRRLDGWRRQLHQLGDVPRVEGAACPASGHLETSGGDGVQEMRSSLCRILEGCRSLIRDMLAELTVMEDIERAVVGREMDWIRRMNREEDSITRRDDCDTPRAGAIWRVV